MSDPQQNLTTDRLLLRSWASADRTHLHRIFADPAFAAYVGDGRPRDPEMTDRWYADVQEEWKREGFGRWAVTEQSSGRLIGYCGLIRPGSDVATVEVAYGFETSTWGRGYATEAATAARRFASDVIGASMLIGYTHPKNVASHRVLSKLGLRLQGPCVVADGRELLLFSRILTGTVGNRA